jgi:hypothetical protein
MKNRLKFAKMRANRVLVEKIVCIWPVFCQFNEQKSAALSYIESRVLPQSPSLALPEGEGIAIPISLS